MVVVVIEGARARARAAVTAELTAEAQRQLAEVGPAALSLRSVARAAGMVSSGVYRYFPSRDDLLTALIVEAYDELGAQAERAATRHAGKSALDRWVATCRAVRSWGVAHPHQWALIYGSPVPGYQAPPDTVVPAQRVTRALVGVVADAARDGGLRAPAADVDAVPAKLATELEQIATALDVDVALTTDELVRLLTAWSQVFGMISLELFGQTANAITAHEALFEATARTSGRLVGLRGR